MTEEGARVLPTRTFEASPFWRRLLSQEFQVREHRIEEDKYQLFYWTHPWSSKAISTPYRDRLALSWSGFSPPKIDLPKVRALIGRRNVTIKDIAPYVDMGDALPGETPDFSCNFVNCDVTLDPRIHERLHRSAKKNLRRSREDYGLTVTVNEESAIDSFHYLYLKSRQRLGVPPYSKHFFRTVFELLGESAAVFTCRHVNRPIGHLICYLHGQEMISAHLAYDFEHRHMRITDYLFINAFEWGYNNGFRTYRFGADNANQAGLIESKKKLGAVPRQQVDFSPWKRGPAADRPNSPERIILRGLPRGVFKYTSLLTQLYFD